MPDCSTGNYFSVGIRRPRPFVEHSSAGRWQEKPASLAYSGVLWQGLFEQSLITSICYPWPIGDERIEHPRCEFLVGLDVVVLQQTPQVLNVAQDRRIPSEHLLWLDSDRFAEAPPLRHLGPGLRALRDGLRATGRRAHAFARHDRQVIPLRKRSLLQQGQKTLFLDVEDAPEPILWTIGREICREFGGLDPCVRFLFHPAQVVPYPERSQVHSLLRVRLREMTTSVVNNVPIGPSLPDVLACNRAVEFG